MDPGRNMGKTNPLNDKDLDEFVTLQETKPETEQSWNLKVADVDVATYDLSVKNPNTPEEAPLRSPEDILTEIETLDIETNEILQSIRELI
jgi:type I restriction enzyme M protein